MNRSINLERHGVVASLVSIAPKTWRIFIDDGRGGSFEHVGSRESAEHRAGWECWCYGSGLAECKEARPSSGARSTDLLAQFFDVPVPSSRAR
jgi:hypothetical protein